MDKMRRILELITMLSQLYDKPLSEGAIELYCAALNQYPLEKIESAAAHIVRTHKYATIPKPAEFIEFMEPPELKELAALKAFEQLEHIMLVYGPYESIKLDDLALQSVIQYYGGWVEINRDIRNMDDVSYKFFRKEFDRLYKLYLLRPNPPTVLVGICDADNQAAGFLDYVNPPTQIGGSEQKQITGSNLANKIERGE